MNSMQKLPHFRYITKFLEILLVDKLMKTRIYIKIKCTITEISYYFVYQLYSFYFFVQVSQKRQKIFHCRECFSNFFPSHSPLFFPLLVLFLKQMQINGDGSNKNKTIEIIFALIFCVSNSFSSFLSIENAMHTKKYMKFLYLY